MSIRYGILTLFLVTISIIPGLNANAQTKGAPQQMATLLEVAEAKFGPLEAGNPFRTLIDTVSDGAYSPYSARSGDALDPAIPSTDWDKNSVLMAEQIMWLCTDPDALSHVTHRGIVIIGARIEGFLDLSFATLDFPLSLVSCSIPSGVSIYQADLKTLVLSGSFLGKANPNNLSLTGHMSTIRGHFLAANRFACTGMANLSGASIGGDVDLGGAVMKNEDPKMKDSHGVVLDAGGASIGGSISFYQGFESYGGIRLNGIEIGGQLLCSNATMRKGLTADGARFSNSVMFHEGFTSEGEVRLVGATVEGNLECINATFQNPDNVAFNAFGGTVNGSVNFTGGCSADGEIRLTGASVRGSVEFKKAELNCPKDRTLSLEKARIGGDFYFSDGSSSRGKISLAGAEMGSSVDFGGATLVAHGKPALFADFIKIGGALLLNNRFSAKGEVKLSSADIRSNFECEGALLENAPNTALDFHSSKIGGSVFLRNEFKSAGSVNLIGTTIGGDLNLTKATLTNPGGHTLTADRANVHGSILCHNKFRSTGEVVLFGAEVAKNLDFTGATLENSGGGILHAGNTKVGGEVIFKDNVSLDGKVDFTGAHVGTFFRLSGRNVPQVDRFGLDIQHATARTLFDDAASWPTSGMYNIDGFVYSALADGAPQDSISRISWIKRGNSIDKSYHPGSYTQLANVFALAGHEAESREVHIARERERNRFVESPILRIWNGVLDFTVAYGYEPWKSLYLAVFICFFACGFFFFAGKYNKVVPSDRAAFEKGKDSGDYPAFHPIIYTVDTFLPIIDLQQSEFWRPINVDLPQFQAKWLLERKLPNMRSWIWQWVKDWGWLWWVQWFVIIAGWMLSTLLVASISGFIKT